MTAVLRWEDCSGGWRGLASQPYGGRRTLLLCGYSFLPRGLLPPPSPPPPAAAFPFFYMEPGKAEYQAVTQKFTGKLTKQQFDELAPIGNSPTFMTIETMTTVMPLWMNTSIAIFKDAEASKAWGWVQVWTVWMVWMVWIMVWTICL